MKVSQFIYLARPHTWPASLAPVVTAALMALFQSDKPFQWDIFVLCLGIALSAQALSNVLNDLFDNKKGADTPKRKGFKRLLSSGDLTLQEIKIAAYVWTCIVALLGFVLSALVSWWLLSIGVLIFLGAWGYSAGKFSLSYHALGDAAVILFFGIIAVVFSYYVLTAQFDYQVFLVGISMGCAIDNILMVNNYRDYEEDKSTGKRTLIVRMGKKWGPKLYITNVVLSIFLLYPIHSIYSILASGFYLVLMKYWHRKMSLESGTSLNAILSKTAMSVWGLVIVVLVALIS